MTYFFITFIKLIYMQTVWLILVAKYSILHISAKFRKN